MLIRVVGQSELLISLPKCACLSEFAVFTKMKRRLQMLLLDNYILQLLLIVVHNNYFRGIIAFRTVKSKHECWMLL